MSPEKYQLPPLSLLKNSDKGEDFKSQIGVSSNEVLDEIIRAFEKEGVNLQLSGVNLLYNSSDYQFLIKKYSSINFISPQKLFKQVAEEVGVSFGINTLKYSFKDLGDFCWEVVYNIANEQIRELSLGYALESAGNFSSDFEFCCYCSRQGEPIKEMVSNYSLVTISSTTANQGIDFVKSAVVSFVYNYLPSQLNLVVIDCNNELAEVDAINHLLLGRVVNSVDKTYEVFEFIKNELQRRKELLNSAGFSNISAYNAVNDIKLPLITLFVTGFELVKEYYNIYYSELVELLKEIYKQAKELGLLIFLQGSVGRADPYGSELREIVDLQIAFPIDKFEQSYWAMSHSIILSERLFDSDSIAVCDKNEWKECLFCQIPHFAYTEVCRSLKGNSNDKGLAIYNEIENRAKVGIMSESARKEREGRVVKRAIMNYAYGCPRQTFPLINCKIYLNLSDSQAERYLDELVCGGYLEVIESKFFGHTVYNYKVKVTLEEIKKAFG